MQILEYAATLTAMVFLGFALGTVLLRWGASGFWIITLGATLVLGAIAVVITWQHWWDNIFGFFADQPVSVLLTVWPTAVAALAGGVTYLVLRRVSA
ncbi:hypothetical protein ACFQX7_19440 [Luedemannella flava]